jgi:hypothetical protein
MAPPLALDPQPTAGRIPRLQPAIAVRGAVKIACDIVYIHDAHGRLSGDS